MMRFMVLFGNLALGLTLSLFFNINAQYSLSVIVRHMLLAAANKYWSTNNITMLNFMLLLIFLYNIEIPADT